MNLIAKKIIDYKNKDGEIWYKGWRLIDNDTQKVYGTLVYNSHHKVGEQFGVTVYNPISEELGTDTRLGTFATRSQALTWAREQIEDLPEITREVLQQTLDNIKNWRYQDEMADDFAYSNGKISRWDRLEREVRSKMEKIA